MGEEARSSFAMTAESFEEVERELLNHLIEEHGLPAALLQQEIPAGHFKSHLSSIFGEGADEFSDDLLQSLKELYQAGRREGRAEALENQKLQDEKKAKAHEARMKTQDVTFDAVMKVLQKGR